MALVNPNIAMSFRQPEFRPRNAMAEYAQMQQIEGGQRQAEVADMQLESLRRERDALSQIQAAIVAKGGPPDLDAAADAMIKTGRPEYVTQGMAIHTARRNQRQAEAYFKQYGGGAAPTMPSSTPGAMVAPAAPAELAAGAQPESMAPVPGVISASRVPGVVTAPITAPTGTIREIAPGGGMGAEMPLAPANALAPPAAAAPVNAMLAPAPAAAPAAAPDANAARLRALEAQYRRIGNNPELASERALVLKQIDDVQQTIRAESATPSEVKFMRALGIPLTRQGFMELEELKRNPTDFERLLAQSGLPKTDQTALIRQKLKKDVTHAPGTTVNLPPQEKSFETGLGTGQSKRILENQVAAQDAAEILRTNQIGRDLLSSGAITGTGADFLVGLNNGLKQVGIDFGFADAAANSQAYVAALGANVGRIIKQFGAGTGLSDADREYAEKIAGSKIALTETALRKILDINDKASNRVIDLHNKNVAGIKTNIPLAVEKPTFGRPPAAVNQIPTGAAPAAAQGTGGFKYLGKESK